jgi:hypothetical protein
MSRFFKYADYDYLPSEALTVGIGDSFASEPQAETDYLSSKRFKFEPADSANLFGRFLTLQNNPEALAESKMKLPPNFQAFMAMSRMGG